MRKIVWDPKNPLNIAFKMHQDLGPLSTELVKTMITIIGETNLRVFTLIVPTYKIFN